MKITDADKAYQQYEKTLAKIDKQAREAQGKARITLRERLNALRGKPTMT